MFMTGNESIQDVLFFPQMRPEKRAKVEGPEDFIEAGIPVAWAEFVISAGFSTVASLKESKATKIHQTLNGFRKKNKLDIPALQLDEVEKWLD
jgi:lysyl-tRNA synthetase class 2